MVKSIFIGNLPYSVTSDELKSKFGEFGEVKYAKVILNRETNRSRGYGFVELEDAEADEAIKSLNGSNWNGREVQVNIAKPRKQKEFSSMGSEA
jgi:RNA recognition motif-containing protein